MIPVEIRPARDPAGRLGVLIQFSDGWMVLQPNDARKLAEMLVECAAEAEEWRADPW